MREELINVRATEPDEAIASGVSGESGLDDEYERIQVMKFDRDQDRKMREAGQLMRRKSSKGRKFSKSPPRKMTPPPTHQDESSDDDINTWEMIQKDDYEVDDHSLKRTMSASSSGSFVQRSSLRDSSSNIRRRNRSSTRDTRDERSSGSHKVQVVLR